MNNLLYKKFFKLTVVCGLIAFPPITAFSQSFEQNLAKIGALYDSKKYQIDEDTLLKYCREYYLCDKSQWYSAMDIYKSRNVTDCEKEKGNYDKCRSNCNK